MNDLLVEQSNNGWRTNHEDDLYRSSKKVAARQLFSIHKACWRILEACWASSGATTPLDLGVLADFFVSQPRGRQRPYMLEGNWVSTGWGSTTGGYTDYRDPDDYSQMEKALDATIFPDPCNLFQRNTRNPLMHGRPDCFSLLPVELRLMILCLLPTKSAEMIRQVSGGMAFVTLEGTFWLSRLHDPEYGHLPRRIARQFGQQKPGETPQWFLAMQERKLQNKKRLRVIKHNQMLIDKMLRRQKYLEGMHKHHTVTSGRYVQLVECHDEPHPAYQKSEYTSTWKSEVPFDSERPFAVVKAIIPTYTRSCGGKYVTGLILRTDKEDLLLGYRSPKHGQSISINTPSSKHNNIVVQSDSRGIFDLTTFQQSLHIMQNRMHGNVVIHPASLSKIAGLRVESTLVGAGVAITRKLLIVVQDNRVIKFGFLEPC